eukprot:15035427-Alexandrium_andersonii.AAC.1
MGQGGRELPCVRGPGPPHSVDHLPKYSGDDGAAPNTEKPRSDVARRPGKRQETGQETQSYGGAERLQEGERAEYGGQR